MRLSVPAVVVAAFVLATPGFSQGLQDPLPPRPVPVPAGMKFTQQLGTVFFNTNIGSFKLIGTNEIPAQGTLDMTFRGTVLVSNLEPGSTLVVTGDVRKEIDDKRLNKQVFFGKGRITIVGKFRAVQFFGRDLRARYNGFGLARLYGEFDRNLETGYYWYAGDAQKVAWQTGGSQMPVPRPTAQLPPVKVQKSGGGK